MSNHTPQDAALTTVTGVTVRDGGRRSSTAKTAFRAIAVLGLIGTIVGCSGSNDDDIAAVEAERDAALAQVATVESERDALADDLAAAQTQADDTQAQIDAAVEEITAQVDELKAAKEELEKTVAVEVERADGAEETLTLISETFPVSLDASLIPDDLPGTYNITFAEAYCDGFPTCGTLPGATQATISRTPEGFLRIAVPGILDAGLFALEGSLYAITDSFTALPQCNGADQRARVTFTMYADDVTITQEGTRKVDSIGSSITIDTPSAGEGCPSGLVFYASNFVPVG